MNRSIANALRRGLPFAAATGAVLVSCDRPSTDAESREPEVPSLNAEYLGRGPYGRMHGVLEKTIVALDVLEVEMRFGEEVARRLEGLVEGREYSEAAAESIARVVTGSRDVFVQVVFRRGVETRRFLEQSRADLKSALDHELVSPAHFQAVYENLPAWFEFLDRRGIEEGDRLLYRVRNDTVRTVFRGVGGEVLLDQTDPTGAERRDALLAGYLAPASELREPLVRSLFESEE